VDCLTAQSTKALNLEKEPLANLRSLREASARRNLFQTVKAVFRRLNTISPSGTLGSRFAGTSQLISQVACPQSIAVASQIARRCTSRRVSARSLCIVISLPKAVSRPREAASNRQTASHAGEVDFPSPGTFRTGHKCPSPLSSSLDSPGTTPEANRIPTALQGCCGSPRPTCGTLPQCGLSTTRTTRPGTGNHSGSHTASQVIDGCRSCVHVARGRYPSGSRAVCPKVPLRHSRPSGISGRFSGGRNQKLPLTLRP
jgi:hypothetical protein